MNSNYAAATLFHMYPAARQLNNYGLKTVSTHSPTTPSPGKRAQQLSAQQSLRLI